MIRCSKIDSVTPEFAGEFLDIRIRHSIFIMVLFVMCHGPAWSLTITQDKEARKEYLKKCLEIKKYSIGRKYSVDCNIDYHHFNSRAVSNYYKKSNATSKGSFKLTSFNLLHPGSLRSSFKDYELIADMMNEWDLVSVLELLPVLGRDNRHNDTVVEHFEKNSELLEDEKSSKGLYRAPGYIKILNYLRKLDPSWALILSPKGDAAEESHVHEMVGFYYRASHVKPIENEHCDEFKFGKAKAYSCIPNLRKDFMGNDRTEVFSRKPFMGSFESGKFDFTLLASHVVYGSPDEPERMKEILKPVFGVDSYENIGIGVSKQTFARWAETKTILDLMKKLREFYFEEDLIYAGDMNLESENKFFPILMKDYPGEELFIKDKTTLSQTRYNSQGQETSGVSNNFDHFIFNRKNTRECLSKGNRKTTRVIPFYSGAIQSYIDKNYIIREDKEFSVEEIMDSILDENPKKDYVMLPGAEKRIEKAQELYRKELLKLRKIENNEIVLDDYRIDERVQLYKKRVFTDQLSNQYYYRVYTELISDHFPITMTCRTVLADDDE